jgi:isoprenylcysteine carboxyl methyltransferase (ICMT) family protein YpbQ
MAFLDLLIMRNSENVLNFFIGISIMSWGGAGIYFHSFSEGRPLIWILISSMNLIVGLMIILRKPILRHGSQMSMIRSFPSLILGGLAFKMAQPLNSWTTYADIVFTAGAIWTIISFIFLARNFSIFPGLRSIVSNGPYNLIRHPSYFGELIMTFACTISRVTILSNFILIVFLLSLALRINEEEKLLSEDPEYSKYKKKYDGNYSHISGNYLSMEVYRYTVTNN